MLASAQQLGMCIRFVIWGLQIHPNLEPWRPPASGDQRPHAQATLRPLDSLPQAQAWLHHLLWCLLKPLTGAFLTTRLPIASSLPNPGIAPANTHLPNQYLLKMCPWWPSGELGSLDGSEQTIKEEDWTSACASFRKTLSSSSCLYLSFYVCTEVIANKILGLIMSRRAPSIGRK